MRLPAVQAIVAKKVPSFVKASEVGEQRVLRWVELARQAENFLLMIT